MAHNKSFPAKIRSTRIFLDKNANCIIFSHARIKSGNDVKESVNLEIIQLTSQKLEIFQLLYELDSLRSQTQQGETLIIRKRWRIGSLKKILSSRHPAIFKRKKKDSMWVCDRNWMNFQFRSGTPRAAIGAYGKIVTTTRITGQKKNFSSLGATSTSYTFKFNG